MNETTKKKKWPIILLIVATMLIILCVVGCSNDDYDDYGYYGDYYDNDDYGDYDDYDDYDDYGDYDSDYEAGYAAGYQEGYSDGLESGPSYGGEDFWDDFWDDGYPEDAYYDDEYSDWDNSFSGGNESWWDWGGDYTYTSNSGIFSEDDYPIGMATKLEGNVIVFSMFVNDNANTWDFNSSKDAENEAYVERQLSICADYLESEANRYGKNLNLIYDWGQDEDLCCTITVNDTCTGDGNYYDTMYEYIDTNIAPRLKTLQDRYNSDSVVIMAYLDTQNSLEETSCTFPKWNGSGGMYEVCYMHTRSYNEYESAAGYAHEMCHAFGAPDLYRADQGGDNFGITQQYVNYNEQTQSNELMYTTYNCKTNAIEYDHISNEITDITAYYLGWVNSSQTVSEWGFDQAESK